MSLSYIFSTFTTSRNASPSRWQRQCMFTKSSQSFRRSVARPDRQPVILDAPSDPIPMSLSFGIPRLSKSVLINLYRPADDVLMGEPKSKNVSFTLPFVDTLT
ncbi:hypothetical protein DPMN_133259 [Dreissena polymorpha]|uniref:Uncharacterized protein n=1 Tax=Dreissena polymorpha TaxID=45954 RepID=A0A9D4JEM1_DREPO|nr:hypothetical protein DPMN_133259 [Dreissena polymorpha]